MAQKIKLILSVFSPCCLMSHDCQRALGLFGLITVALSADAKVCLVARRTYPSFLLSLFAQTVVHVQNAISHSIMSRTTRLNKALTAVLYNECNTIIYTVFRKKHPLTFSFISP